MDQLKLDYSIIHIKHWKVLRYVYHVSWNLKIGLFIKCAPYRFSAKSCCWHSTLACFPNWIHDSNVVGTMFVRYTLSSKKWTRKDQLPLREAITGSNKGIEVHSREAIFGASLPLAVHLFSLAHRNRVRE